MSSVSAAGPGLGAKSTIERRTAHEIAHVALRRAILSGDLPGGTRLVQSKLARDLQLSTTPVREALRDLVTEGLVDLDPHRGAVVRKLTEDDLVEIYFLRSILEPMAMTLAARNHTREDLEKAERVQVVMLKELDTAVWTDLNREFHGLLAEASHSPRLIELLAQLRDAAAPYVSVALRAGGENPFEEGNRDHSDLLEAIAARDEERASAVTTRHLRSTLQRIEGDDVSQLAAT